MFRILSYTAKDGDLPIPSYMFGKLENVNRRYPELTRMYPDIKCYDYKHEKQMFDALNHYMSSEMFCMILNMDTFVYYMNELNPKPSLPPQLKIIMGGQSNI